MTVLAGAGLVLASFVMPTSANASDATCPSTPSKYVVLASDSSSAVFGTRGKIEWYNADLCNPGSSVSDSSAWIAVAAANLHDPGGAPYYAQAGYVKVGPNAGYPVLPAGKMIFSEWTRQCQPTCTGFSGIGQAYHALPADGHDVMFTNVQRASDQKIHMLWDGNELDNTSYKPANDWAPAWFGEFGGEVEHQASDIVGDVNNKVSFYNLQKFDSAGNISFFPNPSNLCQGSSCSASAAKFHGSIYNPSVGGKGLQTWTNPK